jgi:hypothetical protein
MTYSKEARPIKYPQFSKIAFASLLTAMWSTAGQTQDIEHHCGNIRNLYTMWEERTKKFSMEVAEEANRKARSAGKNITLEGEKAMLSFVYLKHYQILIDELYCHQEACKSSKRPSSELSDKINERIAAQKQCSKARSDASVEMLQFIWHYGQSAAEIILQCEMKTRLFEMERLYPPYSFMTVDDTAPSAVDSEKFMVCVREKL